MLVDLLKQIGQENAVEITLPQFCRRDEIHKPAHLAEYLQSNALFVLICFCLTKNSRLTFFKFVLKLKG